eukprot:GHRQ01036239.1.p1 GENE.GHRQ01036239.1~~GHRQ01036239.1.p1  ORF type:complete len:142 (+),score=31.58 GHRQ01036239.1:337-762(+)
MLDCAGRLSLTAMVDAPVPWLIAIEGGPALPAHSTHSKLLLHVTNKTDGATCTPQAELLRCCAAGCHTSPCGTGCLAHGWQLMGRQFGAAAQCRHVAMLALLPPTARHTYFQARTLVVAVASSSTASCRSSVGAAILPGEM